MKKLLFTLFIIVPFLGYTQGPTAVCSDLDGCCDDGTFFNDQSINGSSAIISWQWDFGDGVGTSTVQDPIYIYNQGGVYITTLIVTDVNGYTDTCTCTITICCIEANFSNSCLGDTTFFNDNSTSYLALSTIVQWAWDFGDGNSSSLQHPSHIYTNYGNYMVTLTVFDNMGGSATFSDIVIVDTCLTQIIGCTDATACNYNALAITDDGSCDLPDGCGDPLYVEYDASVTCSDPSACITLITTRIEEITSDKKLVKITDILGLDTKEKANTSLFYIYDDGTVEKRIVID